MRDFRGLLFGGFAFLVAACGGPAQNGSPAAANDELTTAEGTAASIDVLANDSDPDGDPLIISSVADGTNGSAGVAANGQIRYTPKPGFSGSDSFTYTVTDGKGAAATATVTATVTAVADAPVAVADSFSTTEDTPLSVAPANGVLSNDTDADSTGLTATVVTEPSSGNLEFSATGAFIYTPNANFEGRDFFVYRVSDGAGSSTATVTLTVSAANDLPVAAPDSFDLTEDTAFNSPRSLLTNDSDADGDGLTAAVVSQPASGTVNVLTDGTFTYTPGANVNGAVTFTYKVNDGVGDSPAATVTLNLAAVNDAPSFTKGADVTVAEDSAAYSQAGFLTAVSPGPQDEATQTLTFLVITSNPALFSAQPALNAAGLLSFTPAPNANGSAVVTVSATDAAGATSPAQTFNITLTPVNDVPSFTRGADVTVLEDSGAQVRPAFATAISAGAPDESGQTLTFTVVATPSNLFSVQPAIDSNGTLTFTAAANQSGTASVSVTLADSATAVSAAQTFNITVTASNDTPVAAPDSFTVAEDATLNQAAPGVLSNDSDVEPGSLAAVLVTGPAHGTLTLNADGSFVYTPAANYNGADSFRYQASDGSSSSAITEVSLTVTAGNDAPVAVADAYSVSEDVALTVAVANGLLANDRDSDSAGVTAVLVSQASKGLVTLAADGSFTYAPSANSNGADSFTYKANDGAVDSATVTVTLTIAAVNDLPSFTKGADVTVAEDSAASSQAFATAISAGPADESSQTVTFTVVSDNPAIFSAQPAISPAGLLTFTPAPNGNGVANVTAMLTDSAGASSPPQSFTITVTAVNDPPVATAESYNTSEDSQLTVSATLGVLANDRDVEGSALTAALVTGPLNGTLTLSADGSFVYAPAPDVFGSVSFTYRVSDGTATSSPATVTININAVNDPPSFVRGADVTVLEDAPGATVNGWATAISAGPAGETGSVTFTTYNDRQAMFSAQPVVSPTGALLYTLAANANGTATVTVIARDTGGATSPAQTFTITATPVNDPPSYLLPTTSALRNPTRGEDTGTYGDLLYATQVSAGPPDEAAQQLTFTLTNDNNALFAQQPSISPSGVLLFTPATNASGSALVTIALADSGGTQNGGINTAAVLQFTVTITSVNDQPTFVGGPVLAYEDVAFSLPGWATNISAGAANESAQTLNFATTNDNNPVFQIQPIVSFDGRLEFVPALNASGPGTITVTLTDNGGTANGGIDSLTRGYAFTVLPVNDAPVFVAGNDVTVLEDSGAYSAAWASGINAGAPNENGQPLSFSLSNDNSALFAVQPSMTSSGVLTFTPAANAFGTARVVVTLTDGGGTANGGRDSSSAVFYIFITDQPDGPAAVDDTATTPEGAPVNVSVLSNDTGAPPLSLDSIVTGPSTGTASVVGNQVRYVPPLGFAGTVTIVYRMRDSASATDDGTLTITVTDDTTGPALLTTSPANNSAFNASNAASASSVIFTFDDPLFDCPATTVTVTRSPSGSNAFTRDCSTPGELKVNLTSVTPSAQAGDSWTIALSNIRDLNNNPGSNVSFAMAVDDQRPLVAQAIETPDTMGMRTNSRLIVQFNEAMNAASASTLLFAPAGTTTNVAVEPDVLPYKGSGWLSQTFPNDLYFFVPRDLLAQNAAYDLSVADFTDLAGNKPTGSNIAWTNRLTCCGGGPGQLAVSRVEFVDRVTNVTVKTVLANTFVNGAFYVLDTDGIDGTNHRVKVVFASPLDRGDLWMDEQSDSLEGGGNSANFNGPATTTELVLDPGSSPSFTWRPGATYSLTYWVSNQPLNLSGNGKIRFAFEKTVADAVAPTVTVSARRTELGSGVPLLRAEEPLIVNFSERVDPRTVVAANFSILSGTATLATRVERSENNGPEGYLAVRAVDSAGALVALPTGSYTLRINGLKDLAAPQNQIAPNTDTVFSVAPTSATALNLVASNPANGSAKIHQNSTVALAFDDAISLASLKDTGAGARGFRFEEELFAGSGIYVPLKGLSANPFGTNGFNNSGNSLQPRELVQLGSNMSTVLQGGRSYRLTLQGGLTSVDGVPVSASSRLPIVFTHGATANDHRPSLYSVSGSLDLWLPGTIVINGTSQESRAEFSTGINDDFGEQWQLSVSMNAQTRTSPLSPSNNAQLSLSAADVAACFVNGRNDVTLTVSDSAVPSNSSQIPLALWRTRDATLTALAPTVGTHPVSGRRTFSGTVSSAVDPGFADSNRITIVNIFVVPVDSSSPPNIAGLNFGFAGTAKISRSSSGQLSYFLEVPADRTFPSTPPSMPGCGTPPAMPCATQWGVVANFSVAQPMTMFNDGSAFSAATNF